MRALISAIAILLTTAAARADLLQADIYGIALGNQGTYGSSPGLGCPVIPTPGRCTFSNEPYHFVAVFDTTLGALSSPQTGSFVLQQTATSTPLVSNSLIVTDVGTFMFGAASNHAVLSWQVDEFGNLTSPLVDIGAAFIHYQPTFFQTANCPGSPCSTLTITSSTLTNLSAVPGPIVGAGLPGLGLLAGWWMLRRRK